MMQHNPPTRKALGHAFLLVVAVSGLLIACVGAPTQTLMTGGTPAWACPSPTPKPYGEAGPVKEWIPGDARPTQVPSGPVEYEDDIPVYYEEWEQEYGSLADAPPFPSPTPYVLEGTVFTIGQRVRLDPLFVQLEVWSGDQLDDGRQVQFIQLNWLNNTTAPLPIDYAAQLILRTIRNADGSEVTGEGWRVSSEAMEYLGGDTLPLEVPVGESSVIVAVISPAGEPSTVELVVRRDPTFVPMRGTPDPAAPIPTATAVASPTPNTDLRAVAPDEVRVSFTIAPPAGPPCGDPGATTDWGTDGISVHGAPDMPVNAPPGSGRLVELALAQIGKPYVWGATGPNSFDCSGLVIWVYSQVGLRIPARTAEGQFRAMKPVAPSAAMPGDSMYFNGSGNPADRVTHAALYTGDLDGDGIGDVVHAASPKYGVLLIRDGLQNPFYFGDNCKLCAVGFRTMR